MTMYIFYPSVLCEPKILEIVRCHQVAVIWLEPTKSCSQKVQKLVGYIYEVHTGPFDI